MIVNGEDMNHPFYVYFNCECGNHFELKAVKDWGVGIRGLQALVLTCLKCGRVVGNETFEYPKKVEEIIVESEDNKNDE